MPSQPYGPVPIGDNAVEEIIFAPILPDSQDGLYTEDEDGGAYEDYQFRTTINYHDGKLQLPLASSTTDYDCVVVQVAKPWAELTVKWIAEKLGPRPKLPHPYPEDPNIVLLDAVFETDEAAADGDGAQLSWKVMGVYRYAVRRRAGLGLTPSRVPWTVPEALQGQGYNSGDFVQGLIDTTLNASNPFQTPP